MNNGKIYRLHLRLDYRSNQKLKKLSKKSKCSRSEIVRRLINDCDIKEKPDDKFYESISNLIIIGNHIKIISDKAEYLNEIDKENYKKDVENINQLITLLRLKYL